MTLSDELQEIYNKITISKFYYMISKSMPEVMDFDGEMKPGFLVLNPEYTGLESPLLIMHPSYAQNIIDLIGHMLKEVTTEDFRQANEKMLRQGLLDMNPYPCTTMIKGESRTEKNE